MSAPKRPQCGERHFWARLSPDAVREIRRDHMAYARGYGEIARRYGVNWATVRDVVKYRTWRHVR